MKIGGTVTFEDILAALNVNAVPDTDFNLCDKIQFDEVVVDADEAVDELERLDLLPDAEEREFKTADIRDAFAHLAKGEIAVARVIFDRIFDDDDASLAVETALRAWPVAADTAKPELRQAA